MSGIEIFCFSTLPHHPAGRQQSCRTRLSVDKSIEATTPHGPATWLGACVLGVARRFECSELARTAYGACASDGRSADAWTERAPILRGTEGVKGGAGFAVNSPRAGCSSRELSVPIAADRHGLADPRLDCRTRTLLLRATIHWDFCDSNALERNRYRGASGAEEFQRCSRGRCGPSYIEGQWL